IKPLCVVNVQLNGEYWPEQVRLPLLVTLSHRSRISEVAEPQHLSDWFSNNLPEAGTETKVILTDADTGIVLHEEVTAETELTFEAVVIPEATTNLQIELTAIRNGHEAMQSYTQVLGV
ncbi:hypothetical protein L4D12_24990, partial [Photobacterium nomapromontoriensis]